MVSKPESWTAQYFSQANPAGPDQDDVPALPPRIADSISRLGNLEVQDIAFEIEVTADGPWHSMTVYFHDADQAR